ncbi:glycosyltransferase [Escherichia coli]
MRYGYYRTALLPAMAGGRELLRLAVYEARGPPRCAALPLYVPKQLSTLKRLLHLGSFAVSSFFPLMAQRRWKPERIIGVVPTLFCTPGMRLLAKLSGARTVLHIQDYEVDAMLGLGLAGKGKGGKVAQLATAFERSGLHNVDNVSTISRSMMNQGPDKKAWRRITSFSSPTGRKSPVFSMLQTPMLMPFVTSLACRITKKSFFTPAILVKSRARKRY